MSDYFSASQGTLFDSVPTPGTGRAPEADAPRLRGQNAEILARLEQGPVTNDQLSQIARKYTSRISDVRKYLQEWKPGWQIINTPLGGGLTEYRLERTGKK